MKRVLRALPTRGWQNPSVPSPSQQVRVVHLPPAVLDALAAGDLAAANEASPVPLGPVCLDPGWRQIWAVRSEQVARTPDDGPWVTGVVVDERTGAVVGQAGFHGQPDERGMVEVGYEIDPAVRRRGYARATLEALVRRAAAEPGVTVVRASISPDNVASNALTQSFGFAQVGEQWDEEDGLEILFELDPRAWVEQARWEQRLAEVWVSLDDVADDDPEGEEAFRARVDEVVAERTADDGVAAFERGCAFDSTGHSDRAVPLYREALAAGLTGVRRRRAVIQLASSLRNLHRSPESLALLLAERDNGSDGLDDALAAFLALTLVDVGREREALTVALTALAPHLPRYQRSVARYAQALVEPG